MGKKTLNDTWLDKWTQTIIWSFHGVSKKMKEQQHANSIKKQHLEKLKHWWFSAHLSHSFTGHKTDPKANIGIEKDTETSQQHKRKAHQSVFYQFFIKKSSAATKESTCQDAPSAASSSMHEEVLTVRQQAIKAEIIATLQFASQNMPFSAAESLAMCYLQQLLDSVITKSVVIGPNKMFYVVAYGWRPYFTYMTIRELMEWQSYFTLHFDDTVNAQVKKQMDVLIWFWSECYIIFLKFNNDITEEISKD